MSTHSPELLRACFQAFLAKKTDGDTSKVQTILSVAESSIPAFLNQHFNADITSLYDIADTKATQHYQDQISIDPLLKAEDRNCSEVSYTETLVYYRRFLKSRFHPDHSEYVAPIPVPGEFGYKQPEAPATAKVELHEGAEVQDMHTTTHERNAEARRQCIEHFRNLHDGRLVCECCGFDFSQAYREIGEDYIEVHHRTPVSQRGGDYIVRPTIDLVPLCSNCHSMIHRIGGQGDCMSVEELREKYFIGKSYFIE